MTFGVFANQGNVETLKRSFETKRVALRVAEELTVSALRAGNAMSYSVRKVTYAELCIGPRRIGGRYFNGYWGKEYTVTDIKTGADGVPWLTITWNDGRTVSHCTIWDPQRDKVVSQPT